MQKPVLYSAIFLVLTVACGKDKFNTKPSLEIKSVSSTEVGTGGDLTIRMEFTDKEGDVSDSIFLDRTRINQSQPQVRTPTVLPFKVPGFNKKSKGEILVNLNYEFHLKAAIQAPTQVGAPNDKEPDTLVFRIVLRDVAGNTSDTVNTPPIVVIRQD